MMIDEVNGEFGPFHDADDAIVVQELEYLLSQDNSILAIENFDKEELNSSSCYNLQSKPWTKEEDEKLLCLVQKFGCVDSW